MQGSRSLSLYSAIGIGQEPGGRFIPRVGARRPISVTTSFPILTSTEEERIDGCGYFFAAIDGKEFSRREIMRSLVRG